MICNMQRGASFSATVKRLMQKFAGRNNLTRPVLARDLNTNGNVLKAAAQVGLVQ